MLLRQLPKMADLTFILLLLCGMIPMSESWATSHHTGSCYKRPELSTCIPRLKRSNSARSIAWCGASCVLMHSLGGDSSTNVSPPARKTKKGPDDQLRGLLRCAVFVCLILFSPLQETFIALAAPAPPLESKSSPSTQGLAAPGSSKPDDPSQKQKAARKSDIMVPSPLVPNGGEKQQVHRYFGNVCLHTLSHFPNDF
jgi:hypothetical protein